MKPCMSISIEGPNDIQLTSLDLARAPNTWSVVEKIAAAFLRGGPWGLVEITRVRIFVDSKILPEIYEAPVKEFVSDKFGLHYTFVPPAARLPNQLEYDSAVQRFKDERLLTKLNKVRRAKTISKPVKDATRVIRLRGLGRELAIILKRHPAGC
jgi:hypothetical protein